MQLVRGALALALLACRGAAQVFEEVPLSPLGATPAAAPASAGPAPASAPQGAPAVDAPQAPVDGLPAVLSAPAIQLPQVRPKGLLTVAGMQVSSTRPEGSLVHFGPAADYAMGTDASGNFVILKDQTDKIFHLNGVNEMQISSARVEVSSLGVAGSVVVNGVKQWRLVSAEDFSTEAVGWSRAEVTRCGGVSMLGGFCKLSSGEVNKTYVGLPPHKQLRVTATYHFIDRWIGEAAYMKLNIGRGGVPTVVWTEQHAQQESKHGLSLCGQGGTPEGKFAVPIDVTVPHEGEAVQVTFGSTMDDIDPCDESWGVSNVMVYVRS